MGFWGFFYEKKSHKKGHNPKTAVALFKRGGGANEHEGYLSMVHRLHSFQVIK